MAGVLMLGLGGWRGWVAGTEGYRLLNVGAWVNPKTFWELGLVAGWNTVLVLMGLNLIMRAARGSPAGGRGVSAAFTWTCLVALGGEVLLTAARWAAF